MVSGSGLMFNDYAMFLQRIESRVCSGDSIGCLSTWRSVSMRSCESPFDQRTLYVTQGTLQINNTHLNVMCVYICLVCFKRVLSRVIFNSIIRTEIL